MYPKWKRGYIVGEMSKVNFMFNLRHDNLGDIYDREDRDNE